jgi:tripartite-type tricarboxylate transporter receptor subunit TctC
MPAANETNDEERTVNPNFHHLAYACSVFALLGGGHVLAQNYPAGPIRMIVPFPAGGGVDSMGRLLGQKLTDSIGKHIVIENRGGANGNIGTEIAAKAPRDGYTVLLTGAGFVTNPSLYSRVPFDPVKDFDPISLLAFAPNVLVVHPSLPAKSVAQLVALAKARPEEVHYASAGSGSTPHLGAELFNTMARTKMVHVPYKGSGPAITGLLSGEVSVMFLAALAAVPHVTSGRLRALAVTSASRLDALPELPTVAESGLKGYESSQWYGVLAPSGTPDDILNVLNSHTVKVMQSADMKQRLINAGSVAVGSTREQFATHIKAEIVKWAKVIKESGAKVD